MALQLFDPLFFCNEQPYSNAQHNVRSASHWTSPASASPDLENKDQQITPHSRQENTQKMKILGKTSAERTAFICGSNSFHP